MPCTHTHTHTHTHAHTHIHTHRDMLLQHDAMRVCGFVTCVFFTWESLGLLLKACSHSIHAVLGPISCPRPMGAMGVSVCELFILLFYCFCIESTELTCYSTISLPIYTPVVLYMQTPHTHTNRHTHKQTHTQTSPPPVTTPTDPAMKHKSP